MVVTVLVVAPVGAQGTLVARFSVTVKFWSQRRV